MNPEEGELRPQLLDRFGLAVEVTAPSSPAERAEIVRRRLDFDERPQEFVDRWAADERALTERLVGIRPACVADAVVDLATRIAVAAGVEGLRADLVMVRAASALAALDERSEATVEDVRMVAPLALAHRRRRSPFEAPGMSEQDMADVLEEAEGGGGAGEQRPPAAPDDTGGVRTLRTPKAENANSGRRSPATSDRGRLVGDRAPSGPVASVAVGATVRAAAARRAEAPEGAPLVAAADLREAVREQKIGNLIVLAVDASASMGAPDRMEAVKGAVLGLLLDAYQRRDRVALVTFAGDEATVVLRPTGSVEVAKARLAELPTGGRTPLAAGLRTALEVAVRGATALEPLLVVISDGRATSGDDPVASAFAAAAEIERQGITSVVIDAEEGPTRLGLAARLAEAMGAQVLTVAEMSAGALQAAVRSARR
jgi:magnesium chelatase subunit D